ncbi:hypothetical protein L6164_022018 [Bauhinia variegata]|uniref:Uncharacterized protein n=1 Tax=Bauhinia variegata TaxID=167791 RepID=A0ACB9ME89_BAUVA|nr:hypothetical protein L6164_022018 [Bauhinia variegata]
MGRAPCCDKANVKKGPWSPEEDSKLKEYIEKNGTGGNWIALPQKAGLRRCGKSCRLRWLNYLRPNIKHGEFSDEEDRIICSLYANIGSRWSIIAAQLPGRTDNDIKNYWNTKLKKKLMGLLPPSQTKPPFPSSIQNSVPFPSSQSLSSSLYRDCSSYYSRESTISFTGQEPISVPLSTYASTSSTTSSWATTSFPFSQNQESSFVSPMQYYPVRDSVLMFGSEGSCSSSDGSCSQISHGREMKQDEMGFRQNYVCSGFEDSNRFMFSYGSNNGGDNVNQWVESNGCLGESALDYGLEDIKLLISSNSSSSNNGYSLFNIDENKTHEKMMYYY